MTGFILYECSQEVTSAFRYYGHDFYSVDIANGRKDQDLHLRMTARDWLDRNYEADFIGMHFPCTHLCNAGAGWYGGTEIRERAFQEYMYMWTEITKRYKYVYSEQPVGIISTKYRKPDQYIEPYQYGENQRKKTGLWLHGLPILLPETIGEYGIDWDNIPPSEDRAYIKSKTFPGIARAMAKQWDSFIIKNQQLC